MHTGSLFSMFCYVLPIDIGGSIFCEQGKSGHTSEDILARSERSSGGLFHSVGFPSSSMHGHCLILNQELSIIRTW